MSGEDASAAKTTSSAHKNKLSLTEQMRQAWPFTRVDPKLLEKAHKQSKEAAITNAEEAPF